MTVTDPRTTALRDRRGRWVWPFVLLALPALFLTLNLLARL